MHGVENIIIGIESKSLHYFFHIYILFGSAIYKDAYAYRLCGVATKTLV